MVAHRFGSLVVATTLISLVLFVALVAISGPADFADLGAANLLAASIHLAALGVLFGGLALAVGAATASRPVATAVVAIVGVVGYFGNTLAAQIPELDALGRISPFRFYSGGRPLLNGFQPVDLGVAVPGGDRPGRRRRGRLQPARRRRLTGAGRPRQSPRSPIGSRTHLRFDGNRTESVSGALRLQTDGYGRAADRFEIELRGGASGVTIEAV